MDPEFKEFRPIEQVSYTVTTKEEAIEIVKQFWKAMPHGHDLVSSIRDDSEWLNELTVGDRTTVRKGLPPHNLGKWAIGFRGNNQALSNEAISWLKGKGIL